MPTRSITLLFIITFFFSTPCLRAQEKKSIRATRITGAPKIDGKLNDACWQEGVIFSDFVQSFPDLGAPVINRTEVIIFYDNEAMYVGAKCFMSRDSIWLQFTERDNIVDNTDVFSVTFDTYHDGQNALGFA